MPRVIFNDTKGLYQKSGSSVHIDGDMMIQKRDEQTVESFGMLVPEVPF